MTHAFNLMQQVPSPCPHTQPLDLDRNQFINRSIFATSYHHEIGIPIHEIYTWNTCNPQIYTCSHIQASGLTRLISYDQIYPFQFIQPRKYGSHTSNLYLKCMLGFVQKSQKIIITISIFKRPGCIRKMKQTHRIYSYINL